MEDNIIEDRIIEEAITYPYEKVLRILTQTKSFVSECSLDERVASQALGIVSDLGWVIEKIQSHSLYTYIEEHDQLGKISEDNPEVKSFLQFLTDFSEAKDMKIRNKIEPMANTTRVKERGLLGFSEYQNAGKQVTSKKKGNSTKLLIDTDIKSLNSHDSRLSEDLGVIVKLKKCSLRIDDKNSLSKSPLLHSPSSACSYTSNEMTSPEKKLTIGCLRKLIQEDDAKLSKTPNLLKIVNSETPDLILHSVIIQPPIDTNNILKKHFNIHEFDSQVGRNRILPIVGSTVLKAMDLMLAINTEKLNNFLSTVSKGYLENVQYHNSLHAADVTQTIATFFLNSNLEKTVLLNSNDVLALIIAALGHDIGHPGTNNGYQMNTASDIAVTYNDQSVLENFHCSTLFKICMRPDCNIFDTLPESEYKVIRKRIISCILATDMIQHAKVISQLKSKVTSYKREILDNKLPDQFISADSTTIFDEQQKVMDFVIHTADLAHNSKKFKISFKWTELLMDEFWLQGDTEKQIGLPISFLCDRSSAEVPKSQIGFIRGIVSPTFEILVDLQPSLGYLREDIESNLEEWTKIVEDTNGTSVLGRSPNRKFSRTFPSVINT